MVLNSFAALRPVGERRPAGAVAEAAAKVKAKLCTAGGQEGIQKKECVYGGLGRGECILNGWHPSAEEKGIGSNQNTKRDTTIYTKPATFRV